MTLKLKPFRTLFLCHWFGRLAKPTYPVNLRLTTFLMSFAAAAAALGSFELIVCPAPEPIGLLSLTYGDVGLPLGTGTGEARACGDCALATSDGMLELISVMDSSGFGVYFSVGGFSAFPGLIERFERSTPPCALIDGMLDAKSVRSP